MLASFYVQGINDIATPLIILFLKYLFKQIAVLRQL